MWNFPLVLRGPEIRAWEGSGILTQQGPAPRLPAHGKPGRVHSAPFARMAPRGTQPGLALSRQPSLTPSSTAPRPRGGPTRPTRGPSAARFLPLSRVGVSPLLREFIALDVPSTCHSPRHECAQSCLQNEVERLDDPGSAIAGPSATGTRPSEPQSGRPAGPTGGLRGPLLGVTPLPVPCRPRQGRSAGPTGQVVTRRAFLCLALPELALQRKPDAVSRAPELAVDGSAGRGRRPPARCEGTPWEADPAAPGGACG